VNDPLGGDEPQDVPVPQRLAAQRQGDIGSFRRVLRRGLAGRGQRDPGVAAQAPVPAQPVRLAGEQVVLLAQRGGVGAEQFVPVQPAADQLVTQLRR
jgi:hypothetical protein